MAKVRVHELAKELDIQSKDIIKFLEEKNITGKVANSSIEDDVISMVKEKFSGKTEKTAETKETKETNKEENKDKKAAERPKKKSSITAVFNPQNSKTAPKRSQQGGRQDGNRQQHSQNDQRQKQDVNRQQRPQGQNGDGNRQQRPQGQNGDENRQQRPQNDQRQRQDGNRQQRPQNDQRQRQDGNRQQRPQNDQRQRQDGNRQQRPQNDQRQRQDGNRQRPQGDRNNNRNGQNRSNNSKNRFEQEISKLNQNSPVPAVEERGKESRERENRKNNNQRHEKDIMGKKQERFDNLEKSTKKKKQQPAPQPQQKEEDTIKTITLPEKMTIKELADRMKVQASVIIKKLFLQGNMVTVNSEITFEEAEEIALEFNCICEMEEKVDVIAELLKEDDEDEANMVKRPPVVCVMGHVDHGKTSLLDAIRDTHVIDREAGGITQHIGAYMVECNGEKITFLDTPGHEAFTAMRMRGANSTDIAILVVAADDGVMPQTVEAISHAKAAGVEIIVAVNKMDKPSANIERVKQELAEYELIPEDWGGSTIFVPVSARTHEGIEQLLEMILLTAEICELKANPKRNARGVVIEAQLDKGRGSVATVLVQKGTLKVGQPIACGSCYGKVRAMIDDKGRRVKEAGPSTPVEILGLNNVPNAGEIFVCTDSEKEAKSFADTFISEGREKMLEETKSRMSLDDLFTQIQSGNVKELPIIVKADVQGSVEAVKQSLVKLSNEEVVVKVIHGGVGAINESDVSLASASNAIIIGFNVRPDATAKATAEREGVDVRLYKVIYNAIEDVQAAMKGMLDPIFEEKVLGHAEVRQIFKASGVGNIAGSYVLDGVFQRGCKVRISREGEQIFEGDLASLKRFKDDVKEVKAGYECGLVFEGFNDIQEQDIVEAYTMVEVPR
ncbi:translation initiation factor IF-2 [Roseburia sp. MSJ-14]|uniref:translation initiation factor IF-2 n=1 Tax=Roseburia sp. MSJ-14 TaxID=2841514 RepID=UPI001C118655|nr:translation initiation factor IF-2 [Roseburia sp. MSJ-14]MBU5472868.1 translation initiation factor IF-2 [Roseburia sp. MSJ-14]